MSKSQIDLALYIANIVHKGQVDNGGQAYIMHPMRMACRCTTDDAIIVALLHDTMEDDPIGYDPIVANNLKLFSQNVKEAVLAITRQNGESYMEYIKRCSENKLAKDVKILDLEDNMNILRICELKDEDVSRLRKYKKAYKFLKGL